MNNRYDTMTEAAYVQSLLLFAMIQAGDRFIGRLCRHHSKKKVVAVGGVCVFLCILLYPVITDSKASFQKGYGLLEILW